MADLDQHLPGIVAGDPDAFARWVAGAELRVRASLSSFASRVDTEAVVQECLLRVWQVAPRVQVDGRGDSLLRLAIRVAHNLAVSEVRRARHVWSEHDTLEQVLARHGHSHNPGPADPLLRRVIAHCREQLPKKPALALSQRLEAEGGVSDDVLAARVGQKTNTFLQNFGRARRLLAQCLEKHGVDVEAAWS